MRLDKFLLGLVGVNARANVGEITATSAVITWDAADKAQIEVNRVDARARTISDEGNCFCKVENRVLKIDCTE